MHWHGHSPLRSLLLCGVALAGCKSGGGEATQASKSSASTSALAEAPAHRHSHAEAEKAADAPPADAPDPNAPLWAGEEGLLGCEDVVGHYAQLLTMEPEVAKEARAAALAECNDEWPPSMRRCVAQIENRHGLIGCKTMSRQEDCAAGVSLLVEAGLASDPAYNGRAVALQQACADLSATSSYCLRVAKNSTDAKACEGIEAVAEIAASSALGWTLPGQESWQWPEYFKGSAAERSAEALISIDGVVARPVLRFQCKDKVLSARIWAKSTLAGEGAAKAVTLSLAIGNEPAQKLAAKLTMGEHLVFADPASLASALATGSTLKATYKHKSAGMLEFRFRTDGAKEMLAKLDCGA